MKTVIEISRKKLERKVKNMCFNLISVNNVINIYRYGPYSLMRNWSRKLILETKNNIKSDYKKLKKHFPYIIAYDKNINNLHVSYPGALSDLAVPGYYFNCKKKLGGKGVIIAVNLYNVYISHSFLNYIDNYNINLRTMYLDYIAFKKPHPYQFIHTIKIFEMLMNMYEKVNDIMENVNEVIEAHENKKITIEL